MNINQNVMVKTVLLEKGKLVCFYANDSVVLQVVRLWFTVQKISTVMIQCSTFEISFNPF